MKQERFLVKNINNKSSGKLNTRLNAGLGSEESGEGLAVGVGHPEGDGVGGLERLGGQVGGEAFSQGLGHL